MRGLYDEPICKHILVAVERGVDRYPDGLTYGVPQSLLRVGVGHRVKVPLGRGDSTTFGWVVKEIPPEQAASIAPERMKSILSIEDTDPLPAQIVELARWMSVYYCCPLGVALAGALPAAVKKAIGRVESTWIDQTDLGAQALSASTLATPRGAKKNTNVNALATQGDEAVKIGTAPKPVSYTHLTLPTKRIV